MADKRISQLIERTNIANNDVLPIVASAAITTNKVTVSTLQDWMQDNLDLGVTSVGITVGTSGNDVNVTGSPITSSGNITINIPTASATNRGLLSSADWTTFNNKQDAGNFVTLDTVQSITAQKTFTNSGSSSNIIVNHTSGSGIALDITKAGNGEGLRVNKAGGSGNAVTIIGGDLSAEAAKFSDLVEISANAGGAAVYLRGRSSDDLSQLFFFGSTPGSVQNYIQSQPTSLEINSWNDTPIVFRTNVTGSGSTARLTISGAGNVTLTGSLSGTSAFFNSTMRIGTINNGVGDFITTDANGVLTKRTASQTLTDIGGVGGTGSSGQVSFWTGAGVQSGDSGLVWDQGNQRLRIGGVGNIGNAKTIIRANNQIALAIDINSGVSEDFSAISWNGSSVSLGGLGSQSAAIVGFRDLAGGGATGRLEFWTRTGQTNVNRWAILSNGILQSNGAQTIQTSTGNLTLQGNGGNTILNPSAGNVGIGTTSPSDLLNIDGGASFPFIRINSSVNTTARYLRIGMTDALLHTIEAVGSSTSLNFATSGSERVRITPTGNVGIGTDSPVVKFDVRGAVFVANTDLAIGSTGSFLQIDQVSSSGNTASQIRAFSNGGNATNNIILQTTGGNVGIGTTTPTSKLSIVGLPTSAAGLSAGDIYNDGGTLKIV